MSDGIEYKHDENEHSVPDVLTEDDLQKLIMLKIERLRMQNELAGKYTSWYDLA